MSVVHARSGDLLELDPDPAAQGRAGAVAMVRDDRLEVMRWMLPAGRSVPEYLACGPATIHCVRPDVRLALRHGEHRLGPGAMVYLAAGSRHALRAEADSVLLVTMVLVPPPAAARALPPDGAAARPYGERTGPSTDGR
jgi:quercetin dioxygenase-like cupin family protein